MFLLHRKGDVIPSRGTANSVCYNVILVDNSVSPDSWNVLVLAEILICLVQIPMSNIKA